MHWWIVQQLRSKRPLTRLQAVAKLSTDKTPRALELLEAVLPLLKDLDKDVRVAAVEAVAQLGDARAVPALVEALTDLQSEIRRAAASALTKLDPRWAQSEGARRAIPALKVALQDREYWVREAVSRSLHQLGGKPAL